MPVIGTSNHVLTQTMRLEKETPGTVRYANKEADSPVPTLYIRKELFAEDGGQFPGEITVEITA